MKRNLLQTVGVVLLTAVLIFVGANVVDYLRFTGAIARATGLTQEQLRAIGDRCATIAKDKSGHFNKQDIPMEFVPLEPEEVVLDRWSSNAVLYKLGQVYVQLGVKNSTDNQQIFIFTNSTGHQKTTPLWHRDPKLAQELNPTNRLLTISLGAMHETLEWIILRDQIRVVSRSGYGDGCLGVSPIAERDITLIGEAIRSIPAAAHGKAYANDGVADGLSLRITFTSNGEKGPSDIVIENTWAESIDPLLEAVSRCAPKDHPIEFKRIVTDERYGKNPPQTVRTLREWEVMNYGEAKTPWWCIWRSLSK